MRIDANEFRQAMEYRQSVNAAPLDEIEIYEDGKRVEVSPEEVANWKFIGLGNWDFVKAALGHDPGVTVIMGTKRLSK